MASGGNAAGGVTTTVEIELDGVMVRDPVGVKLLAGVFDGDSTPAEVWGAPLDGTITTGGGEVGGVAPPGGVGITVTGVESAPMPPGMAGPVVGGSG